MLYVTASGSVWIFYGTKRQISRFKPNPTVMASGSGVREDEQPELKGLPSSGRTVVRTGPSQALSCSWAPGPRFLQSPSSGRSSSSSLGLYGTA